MSIVNHSVKATTLASGKIKITIKIWDESTTRNTRIGISSSLKPRLYMGRQRTVKENLVTYTRSFDPKNALEVFPRWTKVKGLQKFNYEIQNLITGELYINGYID